MDNRDVGTSATGGSAGTIGERVPGSYARRMIVPADHCLPLSDGVSSADAAASLVAFGTARHALVPHGGLQVGETVLIHSIGSGVASAALQVCKVAGNTVIDTASSI